MRAKSEPFARRLLRDLRAEKADMLGLLERLVRAESPSGDPESIEGVLGLLTEVFEDLGFAVRRLGGPPGGHLFARPRQRRRRTPAQLLIGHCDTVWPRGTLADMPWQAASETARGPGVYDMKAGLVQMVFALRAVRRLDIEPAVTPIVLINSDEEIGSRSSTRAIARLAARAERAFVLEPSLGPTGRLKTARKGTGRFNVRIRGRAAHAGLDPEGGASAILELSYVIQELFALNDPGRGISVNVGLIDGGLRPNVIAPESSAVIDLRVATGHDGDEVIAAMHRIRPRVPGVEIEIEGHLGRPPMEPNARNLALFERARTHGLELGLELEGGTAGGASDGNTTSQLTATLDGLGAVGEGAHARHESIRIDHMAERTALLALLLLEPPLGTTPLEV